MSATVRIAARALILLDGRVLLVNAYPGEGPNLWCAPGGGCVAGEPVTGALAREVFEETGVEIVPGRLAGISEFHNPKTGFHQIDLFFHARADAPPPEGWRDPEGVVHRWRLAGRDELRGLKHAPRNLAEMAFDRIQADYHGLRHMVERAELGEI